MEDLDDIWAAQIGQHEAIVKNVHDLLAKLAWYVFVFKFQLIIVSQGAYLVPAILKRAISTRNFGTIYYCQHPQFKSPKYPTAARQALSSHPRQPMV